ncbi:EAL domain-containing protein [Metabacillus fastidiosus]|uniref:EAL domain-containing protein n=1 Tax=Metabacillus fastidiosus TaxID=1458 RepID=A0ABU6P1I1_9BACI|nr:EAL domain-containing protein [Metabacillus fastidiosus]MED4403220.1 EAL domain-containing protein [Metabacillus fastidiosus]MED4455455.1 EAL domain-containing protein [Metabacillus fastidiosus]MED4461644.1 EAL domain-containing protein [Metabacillus fastidiosus]
MINFNMHLLEEHTSNTAEFLNILNNKSLTIQFQPIVHFQTGCTYGYEALSRGPEDSYFHSPSTLFPFAKSKGLLYPLEKIARELAFEESKKSIKHGKLFINLNSEVIYDTDFNPGHTISLLKEYSLTPRDIVFEITERSAISDFTAFKCVLNHYREQGFQIAIDDAGAGYSSLQAISEIMPDYIKVDRSLVSGIDQNEVKESILEAFVTFSNKMNSKVIAEGIETEEELEKVMKLGIDYGQGFFLARPMNPVKGITESASNCLEALKENYNKTGKTVEVHIEDEIIFLRGVTEVKRVKASELAFS